MYKNFVSKAKIMGRNICAPEVETFLHNVDGLMVMDSDRRDYFDVLDNTGPVHVVKTLRYPAVVVLVPCRPWDTVMHTTYRRIFCVLFLSLFTDFVCISLL